MPRFNPFSIQRKIWQLKHTKMETSNRFRPNVYELLLIRMILRIEAGLLSKEILREKHFQKMADSIGDKQSKKNLSTGTVRSIFGQERNKKELIQFNYNSINKIIHHLYIKKRITGAKTWETFKDAYIFDRYDSFFNEFVPIAHFQQLSDQLKQDLTDAVKRTLLRIYPTSAFGTK